MRFSLVTAVYNVETYLDEFIASLEAQTMPHDELEVIAVDDGSTDGSAARLEKWAREGSFDVRVVRKENGGQGSARNAGIPLARGEWVTFIDPDDTINPEYFAHVTAFLEKHPTTELVATNRLVHMEKTGKITPTHPLRKHFAFGAELLDLDVRADRFFGSVPAAFMRKDRLLATGLRFDERIRPNFEDGHFVIHYLLGCERPLVGFLPEAEYYYRKRATGTSSMQSSLADRRRFTDVMVYGYLDVLKAGTAPGERFARPWIQTYVLYELSWVLKSEDAIASQSAGVLRELGDEFIAHLRRLLEHIDPAIIRSYATTGFASQWRALLLHGLSGDAWHDSFVVVRQTELFPRRVKFSYRYVGNAPTEVVRHRGAVVEPEAAKVRAISYFGRTLMHERILWVKGRGEIMIELNGSAVEQRGSYENARTYANSPLQAGRLINALAPRRPDDGDAETRRAERRAARERRLADSRQVKRLFANAWVLMDRITDADDSAEILFRYLRKSRRDINAWFVVDKDSADFARLRRDGYKRVVAHGSLRWRLLMCHADHLISSHIDRPIVDPPELRGLVSRERWRFTFLQHGVIKDDISRWLNGKHIDLFVTSTQDEYDSIAGDGSPYAFTSREVRLTELPRFDRLGEVAASLPEEEKDLVLVAPTWRHWLAPLLGREASEDARTFEEFAETEFARNWLELVRSPRVAEACREAGVHIGLLPHPNMARIMRDVELPQHIERLTYDGGSIQRTFARARVLVTDHSSTAFNAAYLQRPVVYFHFDAEKVLQGAHQGRPGYFNYERDGFGPVAHDLASAEDAIVTLLRDGVPDEFAQRLSRAFPYRDGKASARIVKAIEKLPRTVRSTLGVDEAYQMARLAR